MSINKLKRTVAALLCLAVILSFTAAFAEGDEEVHIKTAEDLRVFSKRCMMDSYSFGKNVYLDADIDLGNVPFSPVPSFSGCFDGQGHTVSGFVLATDGSHQGLFRYVQKSAVIKNLNVSGTLAPDNSRCQVGGIAGMNYGTIENCSFSGKVTGLNYIGGIAGMNYGTINSCLSSGMVSGKRFTGGICGFSEGIINNCVNSASVNTEITEGALELKNLNLNKVSDAFNFVNVEDTDVVADTGGIAGFSKGVISLCENCGTVGYRHYGYNVGGIAGRQSGFITGCLNSADVFGRKDVAGIVGQMEPFLFLKSNRSLADELSYLSALINQTIGNLRDTANNIGSALNIMQFYTSAAFGEISSAVTELIPEEMFWTPEGGIDYGALEEYYNAIDSINSEALAADLQGLSSDMLYLNAAINDGLNIAADDLTAVNGAAGSVVGMLTQSMNGSYTVTLYEDVSEEMSAEDKDGRVSLCINNGTVSGDNNIGGISGSMAIEYEFDMEDSLASVVREYVDAEHIISETYQSKCVSAGNLNRGTIIAKKDNAGGITGYEDVGTVFRCENYGDVSSSDGGYVGGIAGRSAMLISESYAMCSLDGNEYIGGIAGFGTKIKNCCTVVDMDSVTACFGAIAGYADVHEEGNIVGNTYSGDSLGAIDGISYENVAAPVSYEEMLTRAALPEEFRQLKLIFMADGEIIKELPFEYGADISAKDIPAVPQKEGYTAEWQEFPTKHVTAGHIVEAVYTMRVTAVETDAKRDSGRSLVLLEGSFTDSTEVLTEIYTGDLPLIENGKVSEAWTVDVDSPEEPGNYTVHYCLPDKENSKAEFEIYVLDGETGAWTKAETKEAGSYCEFDAAGEEVTFLCAETEQPKDMRLIYAGAAGAAVLILLVIIIKAAGKKKQKTNKA